MTKISARLIAAPLMLLSLTSYAASELQQYVEQCQRELGFSAIDVPTLDCNTGVRFSFGGFNAVNDFLVYRRVNDAVDLTAACRWTNDPSIPFKATLAASVELIIHNKLNGSTCFFSAKDSMSESSAFTVSTTIISPTYFGAGNNADSYWEQPTELNEKRLPSDQNAAVTQPFPNEDSAVEPIQCVGCHVAGPYIASPDIAPFLAKYGLLNDGHDTVANMQPSQRYHAVGSSKYDNPTDPLNTFAFKSWDNLIYKNMIDEYVNGTAEKIPDGKADPDCSGACHSVARKSTVGSLYTLTPQQIRLLSSISSDIKYIQPPYNNLMYPDAEVSPYRWINRDIPSSDGVEIETFTASKNSFPVAQYKCGAPTVLEAHAVGSDANFSTASLPTLPDKLRTFNTREGLVCDKSDQPGGRQCNEYSVSYLCSNDEWVGPYNSDFASGQQDNESRSRHANVCTSSPGITAVGIEATTTVNGVTITVNGPNDRLAQFSPTGLICKNSDQPNGAQCSNYVVRYRGCSDAAQSYLAKIQNVWTNPSVFTNRYLTTTNTANNSETRAQGSNYQWSSQDWVIEIVTGGDTVRLKDTWSGKYLTASSNNDRASVVVSNLDSTSQHQQWVIEPVNGSATEKRIKNLGSNRYLTVGNYNGDPYYAPILSQSYSNQNWASQRWMVE